MSQKDSHPEACRTTNWFCNNFKPTKEVCCTKESLAIVWAQQEASSRQCVRSPAWWLYCPMSDLWWAISWNSTALLVIIPFLDWRGQRRRRVCKKNAKHSTKNKTKQKILNGSGDLQTRQRYKSPLMTLVEIFFRVRNVAVRKRMFVDLILKCLTKRCTRLGGETKKVWRFHSEPPVWLMVYRRKYKFH